MELSIIPVTLSTTGNSYCTGNFFERNTTANLSLFITLNNIQSRESTKLFICTINYCRCHEIKSIFLYVDAISMTSL